MLGTRNGFIFSGCQVFFSKIELDDVKGVVFDSFNCGSQEEVIINGGGAILFTNCLYGKAPAVEINDNVCTKFINCYTRAGEAIEV